MSKPKKNNILPKPKIWKEVASKDIQYESIKFVDLMQWVMDNIPKGTSLQDIEIEYDIGDYVGYYDETIIKARMNLKVLM
jgi:hypothetical protein